ncbi:MAG: type I methionyl aminopeptidase [Planctomycetota bacterium]
MVRLKRKQKSGVRLKSRDELDKMRVAGRVVRRVHEMCRQMCQPGTTTREIDEAADRLIREHGGVGLFKNYPTYKPGEGFPAHLCISVNEVVVHGIADDTPIRDGDVVGIDCGVKVDGWCGDAANTYLVGDVPEPTRKMCEATEHCLQIAVDQARPGKRWSQIARLMQKYAEDRGYGVVRDFVGHGIGSSMHEEPKVPNFVNRELLKNDIQLREGLVLAIEPMLTLGTREVKTLDDGWTVVTLDGQPAAHYEHTVAVTATGAEVLTDGN